MQAFKAKGTRVLAIVVGSYHSNPSPSPSPSPSPNPNPDQAGSYHSAAVTTSTRTEVATHLYTWGLGEHGRLGHGDNARWGLGVRVRVSLGISLA